MRLVLAPCIALLVCLASGCQTSAVTGKRAFNAFSPADDLQLGIEAYEQILASEQVVTSGPDKRMVERVMNKLVAAVDAEHDHGYEWEVRLIKNDQMVNAFALPGGKMAVYTGILPVCQTEAGLAVVMGHEIAHVVERHGTQRMTQQMIKQGGLDLLFAMIDAGEYRSLADTGADILFSLPFGRAHESDSDYVGLLYMAEAGYDPREAPAFWERMAELSGGGGPPEFLSTHPSHDTRVKDLQRAMPEALAIFEAQRVGE